MQVILHTEEGPPNGWHMGHSRGGSTVRREGVVYVSQAAGAYSVEKEPRLCGNKLQEQDRAVAVGEGML